MAVRSVVSIEIRAPRERVAALWADPRNNVKWMDDIDRVEPVSGELGMPGSKYRLVPKKDGMAFVATVISRDLPNEGRLHLDGANVAVVVTDQFSAIGPDATRLVSDEIFTFKSLLRSVLGVLVQGSIRKAHRKHMESFKRFAEAKA